MEEDDIENICLMYLRSKESFGNYYDRINNLILKTKQNVVKNINSEMVELYFEIGSTINELIENYNLFKINFFNFDYTFYK